MIALWKLRNDERHGWDKESRINPGAKYYTTNWLKFMIARTNILSEFKDAYANHMPSISKKRQPN
jgi:hypothetical protein